MGVFANVMQPDNTQMLSAISNHPTASHLQAVLSPVLFIPSLTSSRGLEVIIIITTTIFMVLSLWHSTIVRIYPVYMMNADSAPGGRQPSDQANRLGL